MRINCAVISDVCMYVCMLSCFRNAIMDFTHAHIVTITHALVSHTAPWPDKSERAETMLNLEDGVYIAHGSTDGGPWLSGCK